jgi:hypothetical protein
MLGGFRIFKEKDDGEVINEYPHLIRNAILGNATDDKSSYIPIYKNTPEREGDMKKIVALKMILLLHQ